MKKLIAFFISLSLLLSIATNSQADSPVTSTSFYTAYTDMDIVSKAETEHIVNEEIATYLSDQNNPIDVKAAVINALGWDFNGKINTEIFVNLTYGNELGKIDLDALSGQELFCIGYLLAMDDYFDTEYALSLLKKAEAKVNDSITISIIRAVVEAQSFNNVWETVETVINNKSLIIDMRLDALNIIIDYMSLYSNSPIINPFKIRTDPPTVISSIGKTMKVIISGGTPPYEISSICSNARAYMLCTRNNTILITGTEEGSSELKIADSTGLTLILPVTVEGYLNSAEPLESSLLGNTPGNTINGGNLAQFGDWLYLSLGSNYYGDYGDQTKGLYKIKTDGTSGARLCNDIPLNINVTGGWIYYRNMSNNGKLYKIKDDSTGRALVCNDEPCDMVVSGGWIYYRNLSDKGKLYKIKTDGSGRTKLNDDNHSGCNQLVGDWIYYNNLMDDYRIYRIKTDGTGRAIICNDSARSINIFEDCIYYINMDHGNKIYKINTDGTGGQLVSQDDADFINVSGDTIFYSNASDNRNLYKIKTDGSGKKKINEECSQYLNVAGEWIYYKTPMGNCFPMFKIKADGTGKQLVVIGD